MKRKRRPYGTRSRRCSPSCFGPASDLQAERSGTFEFVWVARTMLQHIFEGLQHNSWIVAMNSSAWMSAGLEVVHYFSFFVVVGAIAIVDLRIIGGAGRNQYATRPAPQA